MNVVKHKASNQIELNVECTFEQFKRIYSKKFPSLKLMEFANNPPILDNPDTIPSNSGTALSNPDVALDKSGTTVDKLAITASTLESNNFQCIIL